MHTDSSIRLLLLYKWNELDIFLFGFKSQLASFVGAKLLVWKKVQLRRRYLF